MEIEVKTLIDKVSDEIKAMKLANDELTKALALKASPDEIKALEKELKAKDAEFEGKMVKYLETLDAIQLKMKDVEFNKEGKSDFTEMKKKWDDKSFIEGLKARKGDATFEIKTGTTMDVATYLSGSGGLATAVVLPFREPGVGKAPDRIPTLLDMITRGNISGDPLTWVERSARTMAAAAVAEGAAYANTILTYIQRSQAVERLGHFIKVQNKALEDWDLLMSEINNELFTGLERIVEEEVYKGTGTSPHLQGVTDTGIAAAYSSTGLANIVSPNHFDAIRAAIMQLRQSEYQASGIFINPADGAAMDMPKNVDGVYLLPPFILNNGTQVKGIPVIESNLVTAGDLLVGDFKRIGLFMKRGIEIKIWEQNEDDVLYDRKTITASVRCVNRIKQTDYNAFVYDTFTDIITAIGV